MGRKKLQACKKSTENKSTIEQLILKVTNQLFTSNANLEFIAGSVIKLLQKRLSDGSQLKLLQNERDETKRSLNNIMKAIEQGIFTATTKSRLEELEMQLSEIESNIVIETMKQKKQIARENIIEFIKHAIKQEPKILIRNLIQKIIAFDDKIEIYYNYVDNMPPTDNNNYETYNSLPIHFGADTSSLCPPVRT